MKTMSETKHVHTHTCIKTDQHTDSKIDAR